MARRSLKSLEFVSNKKSGTIEIKHMALRDWVCSSVADQCLKTEFQILFNSFRNLCKTLKILSTSLCKSRVHCWEKFFYFTIFCKRATFKYFRNIHSDYHFIKYSFYVSISCIKDIIKCPKRSSFPQRKMCFCPNSKILMFLLCNFGVMFQF